MTFLKPPVIVEIKLSKEVASATSDAETYIVPSGKNAFVRDVCGDGSASPNAVIKFIWDYGGTDELIWTIKGSATVPVEKSFLGDGVKKLAVELENTSSGPMFLSGLMKVEVDP